MAERTFEEAFPGGIPPWLLYFERDPIHAVLDALTGEYYFDSLNMAGPVALLTDWQECILKGFTKQDLDGALDEVIRSQMPTRVAEEDRSILCAFWLRVVQLACLSDLTQSKVTLRAMRTQLAAMGGDLLQRTIRECL